MGTYATLNRTFLALFKGLVIASLVMQAPRLLAADEASAHAVPFSSGTLKPKISVPPLATDTHHHIYDSRFPVDPKSALRPADASVADYRLLQKRLGTTRNVIVQPSTYGVDNSGLIQSLKEFGKNTTRGIAVVNSSVGDAELAELDAAGVIGIRFNLSQPGGATTPEMVLPLAKRISPMGWHIQVVATPEQIVENAAIWNQLPCPVVFDHMGHVMDVNHPAMRLIVSLMQHGKAWVKLSGAYILSKVGPPSYSDRAAVASALIEAAPKQVVWGSDWPHPTSKPDNKPDDALLMDLLATWAKSDEQIRLILVDNPQRLYGF